MIASNPSTTLDERSTSLEQTIRVLHIVESLDNQSVESWLLRVLSSASAKHWSIHSTFFYILKTEGRFDSLARSLGMDVIHTKYEVGDKLRFLSSLREVMKRGRFDILHCHHDIMSAAYLLASAGLPFKKRIVHLHNTALNLPTRDRLKRLLARKPMRHLCLKMADQIVGSSREALESIVGEGALDPNRDRVVHYAVDTAAFERETLDVAEFRRSLGLKPTAKILLFAGRMVDYKNPLFVLEVLEQLIGRVEQVMAVFAGAGVGEHKLLDVKDTDGLF